MTSVVSTNATATTRGVLCVREKGENLKATQGNTSGYGSESTRKRNESMRLASSTFLGFQISPSFHPDNGVCCKQSHC